MNWIINDAVPLANSSSWRAGPLASLTRRTAAPAAWESVRLKAVYKSCGGSLYVNIDPWYVAVDEGPGRVSVSRYIGGNLFVAWDVDLPTGGWTACDIVAQPASISITANGQTFHYQSSESIPLTSAGIYFPEGAEFKLPEIEVSDVVQPGAIAPDTASSKSLEFTVDFYDDMHLAAFNQEMLDEMFRVMARLNANRAYWIHHGGKDAGIWQHGGADENMARTFELLESDDYLPPAVEAAHKAGLPLIGIFKPFETAVMHYSSASISDDDHVRALGGSLGRSWKFAAAHPELCMQRRNIAAARQPAREIVIRSRREITAENIELYVSADNATYSPYRGPLKIEVAGREIRLSGLEVEQPFLALAFAPELAGQIENTLPLLVEVRDAEGDALEFTYGIASRVAWSAEYHLNGNRRELDFKTHGLNFDCAGHGVPSAVWNARKTLLDLYSPANSLNVLGLALSVNEQAAGVLSESEPGTQEWWLSQIDEMLQAGVDGIEIRVMNHSNVIDWSLYGFNPPLVEEYRRLHGIDIRHEEFSREKFRALRGEFFTSFLRRAAEMVRGQGKEFRLHIEDTHQGPASEPCPLEIAMPWRQWIDEKLCDGVTLKLLNGWAHDTAFGREVIAACKAKGIPVSLCSFIHAVFSEQESEELLNSYLAGACDAFTVYEFATLFAFTPEGEVNIVEAAMVDWLKAYPWRREQVEVRG